MGETNPQAPQSVDGAPPHALRGRAKKSGLFGKYELVSRHRVGGMAEVWTAKRLGGGEPQVVALKRILPSFTDEADYLAMFRDEARLAQRLSHPCIVATYEIGQVDDYPYIALEHIRGQSVAALIRKARELAKPVASAMALRIAIDVCSALEYAHSLSDAAGQPLDIVHRDVSPTNILLGYDGAVKLIDFGIAKSNEQLMRTQAGLLKGKHGYLSPEQASGEAVDARSDLFSLAICVWEMLAAKRLFLGASDFSSVVRVREAVVPPLTDADAPEAIERVLQRALSREPGLRHASAMELREAFEQAGGQSAAPASHEELAAFLREMFADEIALEAGDEALDAPAPYEGTGLLDAFDDLEPISTVSALTAVPDMPDEPAATVEDDELDEELELSEVSLSATQDEGGERLEPVREPEAMQGDEATDLHKLARFEAAHEVEPAAARADEAEGSARAAEPSADAIDARVSSPQLANEVSAVAEEQQHAEQTTPVVLASPSVAGAASNSGDTPDEPTRVVAYRSLEDGEVSATAAAAASEPDSVATSTSYPSTAATLPGMGAMEWDDEELSTHLYDGPSAAAHEQEGQDAAATSGASPPSVPPFSSRPSLAPFSPRPSVAPFSSRPIPAPASVRPAATAYSTARPTHASAEAPAWLFPALVVGAAVVAFIALSMFRAEIPGTIQLTTVPVHARVSFDGQPAASSLSPYVFGSVKPSEQHTIEVSGDGFRTWSTQLRVASGQTLQLPEVVLAPLPPSAPVVSAPAPHVESLAPRAQATGRSEPSERRAAQPNGDAPSAASNTPSNPQRLRAGDARSTNQQVAPRTPAARRTPQVVAQPLAVTGSDTGMLRVNSRPWAQVHVDGRLVGNTPQMSLRLSPGSHTILLLNPELGLRKTFPVQIRRGAVTTKIVELAR